jgi:hypothetical protein
MKGAVLFVFFCVCAGAQPGAVEGVAVHSVTGQPLASVHVRLLMGSFSSATEAYGAVSNSAGHFSFASIPAGTYIISADRTGFVYVRKTPTNGPTASLTVKGGERLTDLKLELAPRSIIAGRVLDEYGDPVPNVSVSLDAVSKESPLGVGMIGGGGGTNDRGEFRLRTGPGKYRVRAAPNQMYGMYGPSDTEVRTDGSAAPVYGTTYFPNTANRDQAAIVETSPGGEVNGVEIRLTRRSGFTISGVVTGIPANGMVSLMVQSGDGPRHFNRSMGRGIQRDGKFTMHLMEPAFYRVFAFYQAGKPPLQSQALEFKLDGDVTGLQLALAPGAEIIGTLEFAGGGVPAEKRTVRLKPDSQVFTRPVSGTADKDGTFHISNVLPDRLRVEVDPLPDNAYVKVVQLDGAPVPNGVLDFSSGVHDAKLKVTVGRNGGQITGSVVDKDGQHTGSPGTTMIYLVQDPAEARWDTAAHLTPDGKYVFKAIRPGKYRLFAIDPLRTKIDFNDGDLFKEMFVKAEEIEIKEGDRLAKDVKVIAKEEGHAAN